MDGMAEGLYGHDNENFVVNDVNKCQDKCDGKSDCGSIAYCPEIQDGQINCFLYAKALSGSERIDPDVKNVCTSYYKRCTTTGK